MKRTNENIKNLREIAGSSKEFRFDGSVLELIGYNTGKRVKIDMRALADLLEDIDEEMLEDIFPAEEEEEDF